MMGYKERRRDKERENLIEYVNSVVGFVD